MIKVYVDVGHGGSDVGGKSLGKLEKEMNLEVALFLRLFPKFYNIEYAVEIVLSRDDDYFVSLFESAKKCNEYDADICISIHHNANDSESHGWEIITSITGSGKLLAEEIGDAFTNRCLLNKGRGIYTRVGENGKDYFAIIRNTKCIAIITESLYMDNVKDIKNYNAIREADAIFNGILNYFCIDTKIGIFDSILYRELSLGLLRIGSNNYRYWTIRLDREFDYDNVYVTTLLEKIVMFFEKDNVTAKDVFIHALEKLGSNSAEYWYNCYCKGKYDNGNVSKLLQLLEKYFEQ
jgi:N-acetylmuramoyl-L-alanine amidase